MNWFEENIVFWKSNAFSNINTVSITISLSLPIVSIVFLDVSWLCYVFLLLCHITFHYLLAMHTGHCSGYEFFSMDNVSKFTVMIVPGHDPPRLMWWMGEHFSCFTSLAIRMLVTCLPDLYPSIDEIPRIPER